MIRHVHFSPYLPQGCILALSIHNGPLKMLNEGIIKEQTANAERHFLNAVDHAVTLQRRPIPSFRGGRSKRYALVPPDNFRETRCAAMLCYAAPCPSRVAILPNKQSSPLS